MERKSYITRIDVLVRYIAYISAVECDGVNKLDFVEKPDTIMAIDVFYHTDAQGKLVEEMVRKTSKYLIAKDYYKHGLLSYVKLQSMDYVGNSHYHVRLPYNYLSHKMWKKIFQDNGLKVIQIEEKLNLYAGILHLLFDRNSHFIVKLEKE